MNALRPMIIGNWKMHGDTAALAEALEVAAGITGAAIRVGICPPATLVHRMAQDVAGTKLEVGGQDCRAESSGAYTGDISAPMLRDAGGSLVILGHSERRSGYGETDALVSTKVEAAFAAGLEPIVCVGETLQQREAGQALDVVRGQILGSLPDTIVGKPLAVAYEPVWAIGTGLTPTVPEVEAVHVSIRGVLVEKFGQDGARIPILYGGSVKPSNAAELLAAREVGGALVGGASLKSADFLKIIQSVA